MRPFEILTLILATGTFVALKTHKKRGAFLYLLFARYFPVMPIAELKTILKSSGENYKKGFGHGEGYYDGHKEGH